HDGLLVGCGDLHLCHARRKLRSIEFEPYLGAAQAFSSTTVHRLTFEFVWFDYALLRDTESEFLPEVFPAVENSTFAVGIEFSSARFTRAKIEEHSYHN